MYKLLQFPRPHLDALWSCCMMPRTHLDTFYWKLFVAYITMVCFLSIMSLLSVYCIPCIFNFLFILLNFQMFFRNEYCGMRPPKFNVARGHKLSKTHVLGKPGWNDQLIEVCYWSSTTRPQSEMTISLVLFLWRSSTSGRLSTMLPMTAQGFP